MPYSEFKSVSCPSETACTAVGSSSRSATTQVTLAERWNGRRWSVQPTPSPNPNPFSELNSVSCASQAACVAVGDYNPPAGTGRTLAEHWNGKHWSIQKTPNAPGGAASELTGVSCTSPTACTAVGTYDTAGNMVTLAERWNGKRWSIQPTPNPGDAKDSVLSSVSCVSMTVCTAVGTIDRGPRRNVTNTLAERWDGKHWSIEDTPRSGVSESDLNGVSCDSKTTCTAVGARDADGHTLVERWNGHRWSPQPSPSSGKGISVLDGVSCASRTACTAVGTFNRPGGDLVTLVERWGGKRGLIQQTPDPTGATLSELDGVSCGVKMLCTAVGLFRVHHNPFLALAERHS